MNKKPLIFITISVLLICTAIYFYNSGFGITSVEISGNVTSKIANCNDGSIEPIVEPFQGSLYLRKGITNIENTEVVKEIYTDVDGKFSDLLAPGKYCLIFDNKLAKTENEEIVVPESSTSSQYYTIDKDCYDKSFAKCDAVIEVKRNSVRNISVTRDFSCRNECYLN